MLAARIVWASLLPGGAADCRRLRIRGFVVCIRGVLPSKLEVFRKGMDSCKLVG
jgi:hypothetical protein